VTCSSRLRTFPVAQAGQGLDEAACDFCATTVEFAILAELLANGSAPYAS
jgi:hypothetical protein